MGEVIQFKKTQNKKEEEISFDFLFCMCQGEYEEPSQTFHPMVSTDKNVQVLCGLFCDNCKSILMIENGILGDILNENS